MCGLTGMARHPKAPMRDHAQAVFTMLLDKTKSRGRHATGVAVFAGERHEIEKRAVAADVFVKSEVYGALMRAVDDDVTILLGHTRYATHPNAHLDAAAHPFEDGEIVGAHNGVIYNWREVEKKLRPKAKASWINDSQAAFGVLDQFKNPVRALDLLDGWWALTWVKGKHLYMCRTDGQPLHVAYVKSLQTMYWNSEAHTLRETLLESGITADEFELWQIAAKTIYKYTPSKFTKESANGAKQAATFAGIATEKHTTLPYSTTRTTARWVDRRAGKGQHSGTQSTFWDAREAELSAGGRYKGSGTPCDPTPTMPRRSAIMSLDEITDRFEKLEDLLMEATKEIDELKAVNEQQGVEIEYLYDVLNEKRPEVFEIDEADAEEVEVTDAEAAEMDALEAESPYLEAPTCGGPVTVPRSAIAVPACVVCGGEAGALLFLPSGHFIHEGCVMATDAPADSGPSQAGNGPPADPAPAGLLPAHATGGTE